MTTRLLTAGLLGCLVSNLWMGCDGRTVIGTPEDGSGGSPGVGGHTGTGGVPGTGSGGYPDIGGAPGTGGTPDFGIGGAPGIGVGGAPGIGGTHGFGIGGAPGIGGTSGVGGNPGYGGPNTCPVAGVANTPKTVAAMRAAISREWILCSPFGLFDRPQVGIQIGTDDRWALLVHDASGNVVAQHGVDFEGSIQYLDTGDHIQASFESDLQFTITALPVISQNPTVLIINNPDGREYRYVLPDGS